MTSIDAILIAGPTASGKSALAVSLAERFGGAIVNADSMQVYRDLAILTARPGPADLARAPHHLYGDVDAAINYSVGRYLDDVQRVLAALNERQSLPILVGGTGLYFKALLHGLSAIPRVPDDVRAEVRARAEGKPPAVLHAELMDCDPETAALLRPSDPQRILRALEVHAATGQSLSVFQKLRETPLLEAERCLAIFLAPERDALRHAIDERFSAMLAHGALDEVAALRQRNLDGALPALRAHGVPHLLAHLENKIALAEVTRLATADTRAYAKRQFTFARHQLPSFRWFSPQCAETEVVKAVTAANRIS